MFELLSIEFERVITTHGLKSICKTLLRHFSLAGDWGDWVVPAHLNCVHSAGHYFYDTATLDFGRSGGNRTPAVGFGNHYATIDTTDLLNLEWVTGLEPA